MRTPRADARSPGKPVLTMRTSLLLGFGFILVFTAVGILSNSIYTSRKVVRALSTMILDQAESLAQQRMEVFFGVVSEVNRSTAVRLQNGVLAWQDWDSFRLFLLPMLQRVPQVSAVGAGDSAGNAYNLVRVGGHWQSQEIRPDQWGASTLWKEWTPDGQLVREWREASDFDPRQRPWFIGALTKTRTAAVSAAPLGQEPFWTPPYKFFTSGEYGITVATRIPWTNRLEAVVYFDVDLNDLDAFVAANRPSANGFVIVFNEDMQVLGWPGANEYARERVLVGDGAVQVVAEELPMLSQSLSYWRTRGSPDNLLQRVGIGRQKIWFALRTLQIAGEKLHMLVTVPEDDILAESRKERQRMGIILAFALLVGVGLAFWLAALYTRPIASLAERSEAIQRLDLSPQEHIVSRVAEVQQLSDAQTRMSSALESFSRYVPRDLIAELLRQGEAARIGAHPAELTVLFSDIRHFTTISETLAPDEVARFLSDYFDVLQGVIERHQGTTDKFIGDAIMAFWGAPRPDDDHALHAVRAVLECRIELDQLNLRWRAAGRPEFHTTFGLASGAVVVGNVGARNRLNYTALGSTVNIASRCVGLGRELGCTILALESVATATADQVDWRRVGPVNIRGIRKPMMVCEPLGLRGEASAERIAFTEQYERALEAYLSKDFLRAQKLLDPLAASWPDDVSVRYLLRRCHELQPTARDDLQTDMLSFC